MKFWWKKGGHIDTGEIIINLDPSSSPKEGIVLFSHAHSDHICSTSLPAIGSSATLDIIKLRKRKISREYPVSPGDIVILPNGTRIKIYPSGHVVGSLEFLIETDGISVLYTGDLLFEDTTITRASIPVEADVLIIDSTYGHLPIEFPPRQRLYDDIIEWILSNESRVALHAYSLGKPQELIPLLNKVGIVPGVDQKIACINSRIEKNGISLGQWVPEEENSDIVIRTMGTKSDPSVSRAVLTGWAATWRQNISAKAFPLSSHSHKKALIEFVEQVSPKLILTFASPGNVYFASELKKRGWNAMPVPKKPIEL